MAVLIYVFILPSLSNERNTFKDVMMILNDYVPLIEYDSLFIKNEKKWLVCLS